MNQVQKKLSTSDVGPLIPLAFYGWPQVHQLVRVSREYWRQLRHKGKAPQPTYFAGKALWRGQDIIDWLIDPHNYCASTQPPVAPAQRGE